MRLFKDPLHARVLSGCVFAGAFVWVAVRFFNVDTDVVWVLAWMSVIMVVAMIILALAGSVILRLVRLGFSRRDHSSSLLDSIDEGAQEQDTVDNKSETRKGQSVVHHDGKSHS